MHPTTTTTTRNWHHEPHLNAKGEPTGAISIGESWSYTRHVTLINPTCRNNYKNSYVLWFGAYGWTRLHVYADNLEEALEECAAWLLEHAPGLIMSEWSDEHKELVQEACAEMGLVYPPPKDADMEPYWEAEEKACADLTLTGYGLIPSWEWGLALENPTTAELYAYVTGNY